MSPRAPQPARTLLLHGGVVHTGSERAPHTAVAVADGRIVATGGDEVARAYDGAEEVVDLRGAWVAPAFVDAHLHTVATGFQLTGLDLTGARTREECLDLLSAYAARQPRGSVVMASGWDETRWPDRLPPTAVEVERAAPGRRVYLGRTDGHSAILSPELADAVPGLRRQAGWSEDGRVARDAFHATAVVLGSLIGPDQRLAAARATVRRLAVAGVASFHENAAPHLGPEYEVELVRRAADEEGLHTVVYWGELGAEDAVERLGVAGLAGDLNADGAIGSRTACLHDPYADPGALAASHAGHGYLDVDDIADHVELCTRLGVQAGFHCIGDAALDAVTDGLERVAAKLGEQAVVAARHRLEHVEMPSRRAIATLARLGVVASVQPVFDALWGGPDGMYAERLGERWRGMIPLASMELAGVPLAFGSDGPVTPLDPWAAVRAAAQHRTETERLGVAWGFRAHTRGGWRAARVHDAGDLLPGHRADLAVWDVPGEALASHELPDLAPGTPLPTLRRLVAAGRTVHDSEEAA